MNEDISPQGPIQPVVPGGPVYEEETNYARIYQIGLVVLGLILLVVVIFTIVFYKKANRTTAYIDDKVATAKTETQTADDAICEQEKTDDRENPWMEYVARNTYGSFKFVVPRGWAKYEHFDVNANEPLRMFFSPDTVRYNSDARDDHAALEVIIGKRMYSGELQELKNRLRTDLGKKESTLKISGFDSSMFIYYNKDLKKKIAVILVPFRDRTMFIKTADYDKYTKYYEKFYKSFVITP